MGKIIVVANQKGGVGKTTSSVNIGAYLAEKGKKVLLVDFDPQGNLTENFGLNSSDEGMYEALLGEKTFEEILKKTEIRNLHVLPSNIDLSGIAVDFIGQSDQNSKLKNLLEPHKDNYDYIIIDCPPSLGILTINGFCAADFVIIPLQCEYFALQGFLNMLFSTIQKIQKVLNPNLKIAGVVFTMYDSRTNLANEVIEQVKHTFKKYPHIIFDTIIPRNIRLSEAPSHGKPINLYYPKCSGAEAYSKLTDEVIQRVK